MSLSLWFRPCAHNRVDNLPFVLLRWLLGERAWDIQVIGVTFEVLWIHSLGGYTGGESAAVRLEWGNGICGVLP